MRSVLSSMVSIIGKVSPRAFVITCLLGCLGFSSTALAQLGQVQTPGAACAGTFNPNLSCTSNDIEINDVSQLLPATDPRAQEPITSCVAGEKVTLDIKFTTLLNANSRYDSLIWIGEEGQNPRGTTGTCYVTSLPDDPDSAFILDLEGAPDQCNDTNSSATLPVDQYLFQVEVDCIDQYTPDPNGNDPDDVLPVPDGELDVFFLITWFQNNTLDCGVGPGLAMTPGVNPKCDAALLTGINVEVLPHATIQVVKNTNVGEGAFDFTSDVPGLGNFSLDTTGSGTDATAVIPLDGPQVGVTYNIAETLPSGWILDSATCSNGDTPDAVTPLDTQDVVCTFTNTLDSATINVVKNTVGGNGAFDIDWSGPTTSGTVNLDTGVNNTDSDSIITTETGTFTLQELVPAGWALASAGCVNDNGGGTVGTWDNIDTISGIDLSPGDSVTCTFTNAAEGSVTLVKNTVGGNGSFDFVTDVPGLGTNIQTTGGTGSTSASNVPAGTYSIAETVPEGWQLTSATCSDGSPPNALVLTEGETVTCTFTDTADGLIIVQKTTFPAGSPQSFTFTPSWGAPFDLTDASVPVFSGYLTPGTYSVSETPVEGWELTDVTCTGVPGNDDEDPAAIDLEPGEVVTCVFTNTQDGSIEVVKSLSATGPASEIFSFTSNFNGDFDLVGDAATTGAIAVTPGTGYNVSENDPSASGWVNTDASCQDGSDPSNINVAPGEAVVCTFTNTPLGSATIIKNTVGGDGTFDFTGSAPFNGLQLTTVAGTASQDFTFQLTDGQYLVTEEPVPAGWSLTGLNCVEDGDQDTTWLIPTATMEVQLAETVTCTFTNTADGTLIIRKETLPDGADQGFDFTGDATGTIRDFSTFAEEIVVTGQPGTYTAAESVPDGWAVTGIDCVGQSQSGITYGETDVSVDLAAGETVICTFENGAQGSITIEKLTQGGVGAFQFNSDLGAFPLDTLTNGNPDAISFPGLASGTYMFSEVIPSNWTLSDIRCSSADENTIITIGGAGGFDPGDQGVTIDLADGDAVVCTFVNDADGSISVTKITDPAGSPQAFDFTGAITATLTDGNSSTPLMVPPGGYAVTESVVPGWDVTDISCSDDDSTGTGSTANFVVAPGEVVNCTFTNTIQRGTIIVDKVTDPAGSTQSFVFTLAGTGVNQAFSLTDAAAPHSSGPLIPGTFNVTEFEADGWDLTSATCDDGSDPTAIDLNPGETVTCTFTNTIQRAQIIVDKVTIPTGSLQSFAFVTNYGAGGFSLTDADAPNNSGALLPSSEFGGNYSVVETPVQGWTETSAVCTDDIDQTNINPAAINLRPGETVTCQFVNTQDAAINLAKTVASGPTLEVDGTYTVVYTITASNTGGPGTYDVVDTVLPGDGITLNTATAVYVPGSENAQTGTLGAYQNFVTGESLAEGLNESWSVTANFTVDPALLDPNTSDCDPGSPVVNTGFYNEVRGSVSDVDPTDNQTCTGLGDPVINLAKTVASGPTLEVDGTYTVVYTITASNTGGPGTYDVVDTVLPGDGITLNTATAVYVPGSENAQTGTLGAYQNFVTGESLAEGLNESWSVTANFTVDPALLDPNTSDCDPGSPVVNTGFYNEVSGSVSDVDPTDNQTCTGLGDPIINLAKTVASGPTLEVDGTYTVVYTITASNTGGPGTYDVVDTVLPGDGITLNTATAVYVPGSENAQTGTLGAYQNFVTGESLAEGLNESWSVTANFTVDPALLDPNTSDCDPGSPVVNTGFYNEVSGSVSDVDPTDNQTCTGLGDPIINLAKTVASGPTLEVDGTYTVVYTITASNTGGPGTYDVVDTVLPGDGITLNTATAVYVPGSENAQTGTLGAYQNFVTGESLAEGLNESWSVTANFTVDPALLDPNTSDCDPGSPVVNTGFYNEVSGSVSDVDPTDNQTCTGLGDPIINLAKTVASGPTLEVDGTYTVVYTITASNTGGPGTYDVVDTFSPGSGITLNSAIAVYSPGTENSQTGGLGVYSNFVSGEGLAAGLNESWSVTANFIVDPLLVDPFDSQCDPSNPVIDTGFYNAVAGSVTDPNLSDNDTCASLPRAAIAVPVNDKLALALLILMLLATGWYFRPLTLRKF